MMEPATKRQKTAGALTNTDEEDELFLEPEELNQRRDPSFLLAKGRAKAATQLKSRFEDIFAKYERDFTGIGDEIDLETGEVVVDNGHLSSMRSMKDWIVDDDQDGEGDGDESENDEGEEETGAEAEGPAQKSSRASDDLRSGAVNGDSRDPWQITEPSWPAGFASRGPPFLESLLPMQSFPTTQARTFSPFPQETSVSVDPTWQAPELPPSSFLSTTPGPNGRHYGSTIPTATRTVLRKSLKAPDSIEADDEDDLQIASSNAPERKENKGLLNVRKSPLINKKFPTVDSSPHDNGLKDLIEDVIASIPDTPPSIRRSGLSKAQGRPSPLNQEHQIHSKAESKLRMEHVMLDDKSLNLPKKRGRKPKVRADPGVGNIAELTLHDQGDASSWEESDLESFLDITSQGITKPTGQTLYVDIRTGKFNKKDIVATEHVPGLDLCDTNTQAEVVVTHDDLHLESRRQLSGPTNVEIAAPEDNNQFASIKPILKHLRQRIESKSQDKFERNVVDPTFTFSDEETLLPRRSNQKKPLVEPTRNASQQSPSELDSSTSKKRVADYHGASVNHEPTTNAQDQATARCRMNTDKREIAGADIAIASDQPQVIESDQKGPTQRRPRGRPRAASRNCSSSTLSHSQARIDRHHSNEKAVANESHSYSEGEKFLSSRKKRANRNSDPAPPVEEISTPVGVALSNSTSKEQLDRETQTDESVAIPKKQRRRSTRVSSKLDSAAETKESQPKVLVSSTGTEQLPSVNAGGGLNPGPQESPELVQWTLQPEAEGSTRISRSPIQATGQSELRTNRKDSMAVSQRSSPTEPQTAQPVTPSRPRSKQGDKKTPSFSTSIMSLLSDSDDEEDELSFNLSDFTPSGHHRILAHRPFPELPATTRFSASSTQKSHARLLHSRSRSSSSLKISKSPRAPRSAGADKMKNISHKGKRRKSQQLARSILRVVHRVDSDDGREGSVLQTPGGSKRRCGEDGWKCERDFCFVCME